MATPTITSVFPAVGHSGGGTVIRITGTNFRLQAPPPSSGPVPEQPPSVRVFIGGVEARLVRVASSTLLYVTTERRDPAANLPIEVRNVGLHGETIETTTLAGAYEYARPIFTHQSDMERLIRALIAELVRQVFPEVVLTAHVDWTDDPSAILRGVRDAKVPCVFLAGPVVRPNNIYRTMVQPTMPVKNAAGVELPNVVTSHRSPLTDDLVFTIGAITNKLNTMVSMVAALRDFKLRNPFLFCARSEGSSEMVRFELMWEGDIVVDSNNDESNIRTASATIVVVGFDTVAAAGFESDQAMSINPTVLEDPRVDVAGFED